MLYHLNIMAVSTETTIRKDKINRDFSSLGADRQIWLDMSPANKASNSASYVDVEGAESVVNFDDYAGYKMYFEVQGYTDAYTGYFQLYNDTDSEAVSGSEINTTETTATRVRSDEIVKPQGTKTIKVQHKISTGGGGDEVNTLKARIIFILE